MPKFQISHFYNVRHVDEYVVEAATAEEAISMVEAGNANGYICSDIFEPDDPETEFLYYEIKV